jgi:pimeloyl-ACP methyl ester carboxylesterase
VPCMPHAAQRFKISIPDADLDDLVRRLSMARWSPELANEGWGYGVNGAYLRGLVEYWLDGFDWRKQETAINRFEHFRVDLGGQPVHFIHARGSQPNATPIILSHGWPWTFWDWHAVIGPLTDPAAFGLDPSICFDVVVPSLPGFAFSTPLTATGITPWRIADMWDQLMREVLGYERYVAGGGDWGGFISGELGSARFPAVDGVYLSMAPMSKTGGMAARTADDYADDEAGWFERARRKWFQTTVSHVAVHSNDPQTLAWALDDSPIGLAAWLLERRRNWCDGDFEEVFTPDFLLSTVCLYWFTHSIGSSMRIYAETFPAGLRLPDSKLGGAAGVGSTPRPDPIVAPTGVGVFLGDVGLVPRRIVEDVANVTFWSVHDTGGHFGPSEQPEAYVADLRAFAAGLQVRPADDHSART